MGRKKRSWEAEGEFCGKKSDGEKEICSEERKENGKGSRCF